MSSEELRSLVPQIKDVPRPKQLVAKEKKKGGRVKEKNFARGIPDNVIAKFNLLMPENSDDDSPAE